MSLRPTFAAFDLPSFRELLDKGQPSLEDAVSDHLAEVFDEDSLAAAGALARQILSGGYRTEIEDDVCASVVVCLVQSQQELHYSESVFWEELLASADSSGAFTHAEWLFHGRPFIGKEFASNWTFYAYLTNAEARHFFQAVRENQRGKNTFDFATADEWMRQVEQENRDVFFFAN